MVFLYNLIDYRFLNREVDFSDYFFVFYGANDMGDEKGMKGNKKC